MHSVRIAVRVHLIKPFKDFTQAHIHRHAMHAADLGTQDSGNQDLGPRTPGTNAPLASMDLCRWISSPWTGLLASVTIAPAATVPIDIATLTRPIPGRAVRPNTPPPPLKVHTSANKAGPILLLWLPVPIRLPPPLHPTLAPLCEAQVHRSA